MTTHPAACTCEDCSRDRGASPTATTLHPTTVAAEVALTATSVHPGAFEPPTVTYLGNVNDLLSATCGHDPKGE